MTFSQFRDKWNGQPVDFDGVYPNQCMDLMHQYVYDVLGITDKTVLAAPNAYEAYTNNYPQYFDKIDNTPTGVPTNGDIVFFGQAIGVSGHVCIFIDGDNKQFNSFDANWPIDSLPHIQNHTYKGCLGWLHPKVNEPMAVITQAEVDIMRNRRDELFNQLQDETSKNNDLTKQLQDEQNSNVSLNEALTKITSQDKDYSIQLIDNQKSLKIATDTLQATTMALGASSTSTTDILTAIDSLKVASDTISKEVVKNVLPIAEAGIKKGKPVQQPGIFQPIIDFLKGWFK